MQLHQPKKKFSFKLSPLPIILIASLLIIGFVFLTKSQEKQIPVDFFSGAKNKLPTAKKVTIDAQVQQIFTDQIPKMDGDWSIYIKDLKNNQIYSYQEDKLLGSASVYKLATIWAVYQAIEDGKISKDQVIGGTNVAEALRLMITISDNDTALALSENLGWQNMDKLMEKEGIVDIDFLSQNNPFISSKATADILERIYRKTAVSTKSSEEMLNFLLAQKINDRIPKYLPKNTKVAHKTGEIDSIRNDAGIVYGTKSDYIFVFLSQTPNVNVASENIAQLSEKIFDELEER